MIFFWNILVKVGWLFLNLQETNIILLKTDGFFFLSFYFGSSSSHLKFGKEAAFESTLPIL